MMLFIFQPEPIMKCFITASGYSFKFFSFPAYCPVTRMDSSILAELAIPFPAISMAVPWSIEVLIKGRPIVTLTVLGKLRSWRQCPPGHGKSLKLHHIFRTRTTGTSNRPPPVTYRPHHRIGQRNNDPPAYRVVLLCAYKGRLLASTIP